MLLTTEADLTINPNNISYLNGLGYDNLKMFEKIKIPIEQVSSGSSYKVDAICDVCQKKVSIIDFYIPKLNLLVEIKSLYWYNMNKDLNIIKEKYAKNISNYIIIIDKNYEEFLNYQSPFI